VLKYISVKIDSNPYHSFNRIVMLAFKNTPSSKKLFFLGFKQEARQQFGLV